MKVAILGDIHANAYALDAVLNAVSKRKIQTLLIAGDLVGYYFMPKEVMHLLKGWNTYIIRGNHEDILNLARKEPETIKEVELKYGSGITIALESLSEEELNMLCTLPHPLELKINSLKILLCHGSPWDNDCYIYPDASDDLITRCAIPGYDVVIISHTHYPMIKQVGKTIILNPGSVGQPRNYQPGAHWATLDTDSGVIELQCERYNIKKLFDEVQLRHPEIPYLSEVLVRI